MAVQSTFYSATTGVTTNPPGSCLFSSAQTKGNTNILCIGGSNFRLVTPTSVIDSAGNSYTLVPGCSHTGETGGNWNTWVYICEGIKAAGAGTNEITVVMSGNCGYALLSIVAVEEPASAGVRDAVLNFQGFTGQFPNVTLTGTVLDDVVCAFMQCEPNNTDYVQVGDIGSNPATQLQLVLSKPVYGVHLPCPGRGQPRWYDQRHGHRHDTKLLHCGGCCFDTSTYDD